MQHAQKSHAKSPPQRFRGLDFIRQRRVVQFQFIQRVFQCGELVRVRRINRSEHYRFRFVISGHWLLAQAKITFGDNRISAPNAGLFQTRRQVADLPRLESFGLPPFGSKVTDLEHFADFTDGEHSYTLAFSYASGNNAYIDDYPLVGIELRVKNQRAKRLSSTPFRHGDNLDNAVKQSGNSRAGLAGNKKNFREIDAKKRRELARSSFGISVGK